MPPSIHDRLAQHLSQGKFHLAEQDIQKGARFQPHQLERALGPAHRAPAAQQLRVLNWLHEHQQPLPSPDSRHDVKVMLNHWLVRRPIALLDRALVLGYTFEPTEGGVFEAIRRPDVDGLAWWHRQGLPMKLPPMFEQDLLSVSLSMHRFQALPHVQFLWEHGHRPPASAPSPLRQLAQWHREAPKAVTRYEVPPLTLNDAEGFRALWAYLVSVGNDPATPDSDGVSAADVMATAPSVPWYQPPSQPSVRRRRPR